MAVRFTGGGKQSTEIKPPTCPNRPPILSHNVVSNTPPWAVFKFTNSVVICTDCSNCKSNYYMITTTTTLIFSHIVRTLYIWLHSSLLNITHHDCSHWYHVTEVIVELIHFRLKVWQHRTSLMKSFAHFVTLHQLKQWVGVPNVMIFCVPIV